MWRWDKEDLGTHQLPAVRGAHCLFGGEGLTAAYVQYEQGRGYGWLQSVVFWFLHMRRLEEVVMTSLRTREGLSPAVSATPFVTSNHLV